MHGQMFYLNKVKLIVQYCLVYNIVIRNNVCFIYIRPNIEALLY